MGELVVLPSSLVTASSFSLCEPRFLIILFILAFSRTDSVFVQNSRHLFVIDMSVTVKCKCLYFHILPNCALLYLVRPLTSDSSLLLLV